MFGYAGCEEQLSGTRGHGLKVTGTAPLALRCCAGRALFSPGAASGTLVMVILVPERKSDRDATVHWGCCGASQIGLM
jgi:hypothetical protein